MARWLSSMVAVVVLAACGSSTAATSAVNLKGCGPAGARTLASSSGARVYAQDGFVYACARASGHRYRLGTATRCVGSARVGPAAAAGEIVAYAVQRCGADTGSASVVVRPMSDGKGLFTHAAVTGPSGPESFQSVGSLVVNRRGGAAWIVIDHAIVSHHLVLEVVEATGSSTRVLASGASIDARSLRLHGSRLTWKAGGAERSATLG